MTTVRSEWTIITTPRRARSGRRRRPRGGASGAAPARSGGRGSRVARPRRRLAGGPCRRRCRRTAVRSQPVTPTKSPTASRSAAMTARRPKHVTLTRSVRRSGRAARRRGGARTPRGRRRARSSGRPAASPDTVTVFISVSFGRRPRWTARPYGAASTTSGRSTRRAWPRGTRGLTGRERRRTHRTRPQGGNVAADPAQAAGDLPATGARRSGQRQPVRPAAGR